MKQDDNSPAFPLCGWDVGFIQHQQAILFRPHFLARHTR